MRSVVVALCLAACGGNSGSTSKPDAAASIDAPVPMDAPAFMQALNPGFPAIGSRDHVVLSPAVVVTIVASNDTYATQLQSFGNQLVASNWWSAVSAGYSLGTPTSMTVVGPAIAAGNMSNAQMQAYIQALITANQIPAANGKTVYMLYLPNGVVYTDPSTTNTNCNYLEGAHFTWKNGPDQWAFAQRCYGDTQAGLDDVTNTGSHEVIESVTDPTGAGWGIAEASPVWSGDPWGDIDGGYLSEVGDLCAGTIWTEGGFQYQRSWSTAAAATGGDPCVPAITDPYYNTSPAHAWNTITAGQSLAIPLTAWSVAKTVDWSLSQGAVLEKKSNELTATISAPRTAIISGTRYPVVHNGEVATLTVTAPANAVSGDWAVYLVYSETTASTGDWYHIWPVGVYVP